MSATFPEYIPEFPEYISERTRARILAYLKGAP